MILTPKDLEETIHIHVDPEGETIGPVNIEIHGGTLRMGQLKITSNGAMPGVIIDGGGNGCDFRPLKLENKQ